MMLVVVYVGAVAVLFLFVVMMLDVDFAELRQGFCNICRSGTPSAPCSSPSSVRGRGLGDRARGGARDLRCRRRRRKHAGAGEVLYTRYVFVSSRRRHDPLYRDDRGDRHDLQRKPASGVHAGDREQVARIRRRAIEVRQGLVRGIGGAAMTIGLLSLSVGRRDPVHNRDFRHLSQPQASSSFDVGRVYLVAVNMNLVAFLAFLGRTESARCLCAHRADGCGCGSRDRPGDPRRLFPQPWLDRVEDVTRSKG